MESRVLMDDFEFVSNSNLPFEKYRKKVFLITGATGFIGSLLIKNLIYCNEKYNLKLEIIGLVRNYNKVKTIYKDECNYSYIHFITHDLQKAVNLSDLKVDYIIHTAAGTASKNMVEFPVNNIKTSINGTLSILECALENEVKGMVYISSMEAYGALNNDGMTTENELGYINLSSARSCYPESKRMCECMCNAYHMQYGIRVVNARLAQTFGAGILSTENRVFAQFARSVIEKKNIVLHTKGLSEGNYVYSRDAVIAILLLLTEGIPGETYNISNEKSHVSIGKMAELVAKEVAENKIKIIYDIPVNIESLGYAPDVKLHLSSKKMRKLGWNPEVGLVEAYQRMICYMKEEEN